MCVLGYVYTSVCVCGEGELCTIPSVDTGADGDALLPQTVSRG